MNKTISLMLFMFGLFTTVMAQTTIIAPNAAGGFETGDTFSQNGWNSVINGSDLQVSTNSNYVSSGTRGCWFSATLGSTNTSHIYRDFTVKSEKYYTISFKYKTNNVTDLNERVYIYLADTNLTPTTASNGFVGSQIIRITDTQSNWTDVSATLLTSNLTPTNIEKRVIVSFSKYNATPEKWIAVDELELREHDLVTYYSTGNNSPSILTNWNTSPDGIGSSPLAWDNWSKYVIQAGHTLTTTAAWNIGANSLLSIEAGGTLYIAGHTVTASSVQIAGTSTSPGLIENSGTLTSSQIYFLEHSKYRHLWASAGSGTIPTANWHLTSTCEIAGYTTNSSNPGGLTNDFGNFIWNCPNQSTNISAAGNLTKIRGNFSVLSTGTGSFRLAANTSPNLLVGGNVLISNGIFSLSTGTGNAIVTVSGDFIQNGGRIDETSSGSGSFIFAKSGIQTFTKTSGTIANNIHFIVNNGSTLDLGNSVLDGSSGAFTLNSGSGIATKHAQGISTTTSTGCIQVSGTKTYSSTANYTYNGVSAQVTGNGLIGANNLFINNYSGVTLSSNVVLGGNLMLDSGELAMNGNTLTIAGSALLNGGAFAAGSNPSLDGYENNRHYLSIEENGSFIDNFSAETNTNGDFPEFIKRTWIISGSAISGNKNVTFKWSTADDDDYNWTDIIPAVWQGSTKLATVSYGNRTITVTMTDIGSKDIFVIGRSDGGTLPVVLSSFLASINANGKVQLLWVTQSETNLLGYYLHRSRTPVLMESVIISPLISATNTSLPQTYLFTDAELSASGTYCYWLQACDLDGSETFHGPLSFSYNGFGDAGSPDLPLVTGVTSIYPNPFNPSVTIYYQLEKTAEVVARIYNIRGQLVRVFREGNKTPNSYKLLWDGCSAGGVPCASGVYWVELMCGQDRFMRKVVLSK